MATDDGGLHIETVDPLLVWLGVIVAGGALGGYSLYMRDLIRRGRLHRRTEKLIAEGEVSLLPAGRVACPECAEAILPAARRCPYCRSVVVGRI